MKREQLFRVFVLLAFSILFLNLNPVNSRESVISPDFLVLDIAGGFGLNKNTAHSVGFVVSIRI